MFQLTVRDPRQVAQMRAMTSGPGITLSDRAGNVLVGGERISESSNDPLAHEHMTLADVFIKSSHNTSVSAWQLFSACSVTAIVHALVTAQCRCIECFVCV